MREFGYTVPNRLGVIDNDYETTYLGVVIYTYYAGYKINGSVQGTVECAADGKWNISSSEHVTLAVV